MKKKKGFTLSEVLITLTVIGIIAAITINILNTNAREAEVETKLKRMVGILNMALFRASIEHGPSYTWQESDSDLFNEKYLIPNLRLIKPPIAQSLSDIGYKKIIKDPQGNDYHYKGASEKKLFLSDGSIILHTLRSTPQENMGVTSSIVYVFDINGRKGPNVMGRDVFVIKADLLENVPSIKMSGTTGYKAVQKEDGSYDILPGEYDRNSLRANCSTQGIYCGALIQQNSWKIPDDYPIKI